MLVCKHNPPPPPPPTPPPPPPQPTTTPPPPPPPPPPPFISSETMDCVHKQTLGPYVVPLLQFSHSNWNLSLIYLHLISHWKVHRPDAFQHLSSSILSFNSLHQDELDLVNTFIEDLFTPIEKNTFIPYPSSVITMKSFTAFSSQIGHDSSSSHFDPSLFPRLWPANFSEQSTQVCMKLSSLFPASTKKQRHKNHSKILD